MKFSISIIYFLISKRFNEICKSTFPQHIAQHQIGTYSTEQYPLLIGVRRFSTGDYIFHRLINGSSKRPNIDEFLAILIEFKFQFDFGEEDIENVKIDLNII